MGTRLDSTMRGFLVPDPRLGCDDLATNDGSAAGSNYTETGPRPGSSTTTDPLSRIVPFLTGAQARGIEIDITAAGDPGIELDAARSAWRFENETRHDWHGYTDPNWSTVWIPVAWLENAAEAGTFYGACVDPESQRVVVIHNDNSGVNKAFYSRVSSGLDGFSAASLVWEGTAGAPARDSLAVCVLPSGRILAYAEFGQVGDAWYSDDLGATWEIYSEGAFGGAIPIAPQSRIRDVTATREGEVLALFEHDGGNEISQFASRNLGTTFEPIELNVQIGTEPTACMLPSGRIAVVYANDTDGSLRCRIIASPFDPISDAPEITVGTTAGTKAAACVDGRGVLWAFGGGVNIRCYSSTDEGQTWHEHDYSPIGGSGGDREAEQIRAVSARGFVYLLHRPLDGGPGTRNDAIGAFRLGGWSNLEPKRDAVNDQRSWVDGEGDYEHRFWFPSGEPSEAGFSHNGAVNGVVDDLTAVGEGALLIDTAIGQDGWYDESTTDGDQNYYLQVSLALDGGQLTSGDLGAVYAGGRFRGRTGSGGTESEFEIRLKATAGGDLEFRIYDTIAGAVVYDGVGDLPPPRETGPEPFLELLIFHATRLGGAFIKLWWRTSDRARWVQAKAAIPFDFDLDIQAETGAANIAFGNLVAADATSGRVRSVWRAFMYAGNGGAPGFDIRPELLAEFSGIESNVAFTDRPNLRGAAIGPTPLSLVNAGELDVDEAFLGFRGGPARFGEQHAIEPIHDFPIDAAFWDCRPSRSEVWRSLDDTVDQIVAFEFPEQTRIGGSFLLGLFVAGANFPTARLEIDTVGGGAGWSTVATLNLARQFEALGYERAGDTLRPGAAPINEGGRFLNRAELVGGVARWGAGGSAGVARIVRQSAGGWTDKTTNTIQPFIGLDPDAVAGTATAGNDLDLQAPAGLVVAELTEAVGLVYGVRVVVEATTTPEGYHEAGLLMVGSVAAFGQQWSRGYSVDTRPNATRTTSTGGTVRKTQLGEPATRFSIAWPDGVKLHEMRQGIDVDYLGPAGRPPVVADHDVWGQLWGLLDETKSGELPVVIITRIPGNDRTLTDRTLFAFATLDGSARFDHVLGDEGENEFGRVAGVVAQEIK